MRPPHRTVALLAALACHGAVDPADRSTDADSDVAPDTDTDLVPTATLRVTPHGSPSGCEGTPATHFASSWSRTPSVAAASAPLVGMGFSVDDLDDDGWPDLVLPHHLGVDLFWGTPAGFSETATPLGTELEDASVVAVLDLDGDADLDLVVLRVLRPAVVFSQTTRRTFEHTPIPLLERDVVHSLGASVGDFDHDGRLDLFVANWGRQPIVHPVLAERAFPNALFRNTSTGWKDASYLLPSVGRQAWSMLGAWQDFDADGRDDLFLVNDFGRDDLPSRLLWSRADGFEVADDALGLAPTVCGMGLGIADFNADQVPDVVISSWGSVAMRESRQGQWFDTAATRGLTPDTTRGQVVAWGVEAADVDNDLDSDVFVAFGHFPEGTGDANLAANPLLQPDGLFLDDGGRFTDVAPAWGVDDSTSSRGVGLVDLNQDGWLDLMVREADGALRGHVAACGAARGISVRLTQPGTNPRAIGARVTLSSGGVTQTRWLRSGGTGHGTFMPVVAHFGVGDATTIDRVEVAWPDGTSGWATDVPVTPSWTIERPLVP